MLETVNSLLQGPSGSFSYHLLILFVIEAGLVVSYGSYRRSKATQALALSWAWGLLLLLRAFAVLVALLALPGRSLPPYRAVSWLQFLDTAAVLLMVWGFVLAPRLWPRGAWLSLSSACLVLLVVAIVTLAMGGTTPDLSTWYWITITILALGITLAWGLTEGRWSVITAFVFLLIGAVLQVALLAEPHLAPVWQRLGHVVGFPLAVAATYTIAREKESQHLLVNGWDSTGAGERLTRLLTFFDGVHDPDSDPSLPSVLKQTAHAAATSLKANECAIILAEHGASDILRLAEIYNPDRKGQGEAVSFPVKEQQVLQKAFQQQHPLLIPSAQEHIQLQVLLALMGASGGGPVLIMPLSLKDSGPGAILVSRTRTKEPFSEDEIRVARKVALAASSSLQAGLGYQVLEQKIADLDREVRSQEVELSQYRSTSQKQISRGKAEADLFAQRLFELEKELEEREDLLQGARVEVAQQITETHRAREEAEALSRKLEAVIRERIELEDRIGVNGTAEDRQRDQEET